MPRVLASATVDLIRQKCPTTGGVFSVTVWGQPPYTQTRIYEIHAENDTKAAQQGIDRFVNEMEDLPVPEGNQ